MPRQNRAGMEGLVPKVRKRGCSSSSSASSRVHNYRFKRAIVVGKARHGLGPGLGGSRSSTPVPLWKTTPLLRTAVESPSVSQAGTSRPVSARKLAATLWEMNEVPSPRVSEDLEQRRTKKMMLMMMMKKEKMRAGHSGSDSVSGSLPPHLCDPSHSPVSERFHRSGSGSYRKRTSTTSHRLRPIDHNVGVVDSLSSASLMEMDTRSHASVSVVGVKSHLKDISNALITSKELLKIINRIWVNADPPSSSMSLVSALHAELERARLQVNQLIQEPSSDQSEINYVIKSFGEEKAAWKNKIESIGNELEVERKLRRRCENLNGKLGKELSETKASFVKVLKELETEKRAREVIEQVCNDLAKDIGEDRAEVEELKRDSAKVQEEIEKEREMLQIADKLREERVHMKLSEGTKNQFEEKSSAVDKLRKQLEAFLGKKKSKRKGNGSLKFDAEEKTTAACLNKTPITSHRKEDDGGEVVNVVDCGEESAESDLHSIELNTENANKTSRAAYYPSAISRESKRVSVDEMKVRNSLTGHIPRRSSTVLRSISDAVEWGPEAGNIQNPGDGTNSGIDWEKLGKKYAYAEEMQRIKAIAGMKNHTLGISSPYRQWDQPPRSSRDPCGTAVERYESTLKSRFADIRGEERSVTRSKR